MNKLSERRNSTSFIVILVVILGAALLGWSSGENAKREQTQIICESMGGILKKNDISYTCSNQRLTKIIFEGQW